MSYFHLDRIGSPIMITDESGNVVKEKKYEAFGNIVWEEGIHNDNREFTSKEKDPTGFHYFGARYYYGNIGRFLSPDPHTVMPGNINLANSQETNPYVYCYNNPVNLVDPDGKEPCTITIAVVGAGVFVAVDYTMAWQASGMSFTDYYKSGEYSWQRELKMAVAGALFAVGVAEGCENETDYGPGNDKTGGKPGKLTDKDFKGKTAKEAQQMLQERFGDPRSEREGAKTYFDEDTKRSYNVHYDPDHGSDHVDIKQRGVKGYDQIDLEEEQDVGGINDPN